MGTYSGETKSVKCMNEEIGMGMESMLFINFRWEPGVKNLTTIKIVCHFILMLVHLMLPPFN